MKAGWKLQRLGDLCAFDKSQGIHTNLPYVGLEHIESDTGQYLGNLEPTDVKSSTFKFNDSHVLYGRLRPYLNKVLLPDFEGHCSTEIFPIQIKPGLLREYLGHWLMSESVVESINTTCTGARMPRADMNAVLEFNIPVPSEQEQRRIVTLLDEAFADIATAKANAEKNLRNARELFTSHLQSVFTRQGLDWVVQPLGDIGKVSMCKRIFKEQTTPTGDIPFYKIGTFGKEPDAFIPAEIYHQFRQKYSFPNKGDVLVSAAGTVGRRVVYDGEDAYFQDSNIVWISNDQTKVLNHFLYHFYSACDWNSTKGATISRLYNDNLRQIVIAYPQSLDEQNRIAAQLDVLSEKTNQLTDIYRQKLTALDDLKKSLLHQAFSGQL